MDALYIHIPFCDKICTYCDFAKVYSDTVDHKKYLDALEQEYMMYQDTLDFSKIKTIYFGGGTPSALSVESIEYLFKIFAKPMSIAEEITFEANPESLTADKITVLQKHNVTRVSIGIQTFDEQKLRYLGRKHRAKDIEYVTMSLCDFGLTNYSFDLIYGLPNQTLEELQKDVRQLLQLNPEHISIYALIVEEHTKLFLDIRAHKFNEVAEEIQAEMYTFIQKELADAGYQQYEVSNWSKSPATQSKHNMTYWSMSEYLGIGLGSHGFIHGRRYGNTKSISNYFKYIAANKLPVVIHNDITLKEQMEEFMFLGLRKTKGIDTQEFRAKFSQDIYSVFGEPLNKHISLEHILVNGDYLTLAQDAIFISNDILSDFLLDN